MFNYECSRRGGEVVGACMDGFLFGACCQLPPRKPGDTPLDKTSNIDDLLHPEEIDHVPDIPILLGPNGTPMGIALKDPSIKSPNHNHLSDGTTAYTKIPALYPSTKVTFDKVSIKDDADLSNLEEGFSSLLGQQQIMNDLGLPSILSHPNNGLQEGAVSPVTTLLSPDEVMQVADPVNHLPALFAQGVSSNANNGPDTILLNENGTVLDEENNPDEFFRPQFSSDPVKLSSKSPAGSSVMSKKTTKMPMSTQKYASMDKLTKDDSYKVTDRIMTSRVTALMKSSTLAEHTTPMSYSTGHKDGLVRVPTISHNKKDDVPDSEEIAIHHIISILNDTTPNGVSTQKGTKHHS